MSKFKRKYNLNTHLIAHNGRISCGKCSATFKHVSSFTRHVKNINCNGSRTCATAVYLTPNSTYLNNYIIFSTSYFSQDNQMVWARREGIYVARV